VLEVADQAPDLEYIVVSRADGPLPECSLRLETVEDFLGGATELLVDDPPGATDIGSVTYTSGTTGPSKGVLFTWAQFFACTDGTIPFEDLRSGDVFYSTATMHHGSGRLPLLMMALCGGTLVARDRFSGSEFWDDVHTHGCTLGAFIGAMSHFVWNQPPSPADADNPMRLAVMFPVIPQHEAFQQRFGLKIRTVYSMTEIGPVLGSGWSPKDPASCGTAQPGYEVRIADENDYEIPNGQVGELIVRSEHPWILTSGYLGMPEATARAWRNGWFHTGDALRRDEVGNYFFVDRIKDAIRRRGENISSAEVEAHVNEHPDVLESAAVALPSEWGEDEIKIVISCRSDSDLTPEALIGFLAERMPRFMVPRYVEFVSQLPKTDATMRIRKFELREAGLTPTTWDREAAGINLDR
jgi:crotonobetaine/carnitine-CoA ligase